MSAYIDPRDGKTWRFRTWAQKVDGSRVKLSGTPGVNTKAAAQLAERNALAALAKGHQPKPAVPTKVITFGDYADRFMTVYAVTNKPSEQASKRAIFDNHLLPAWAKRPLAGITKADVQELVARLLKSKLSRKTVNNVLHVVSKLFREAVEAEVIVKAPKIQTLKVGRAEFDFFTFEEYEQLVAGSKAEPTWYAMVVVAGETGLRLGELRGLSWDDINLDFASLTVNHSRWRDELGTPKSGNMRVVPLTARCVEALQALPGRSGSVFTHDGQEFLSNTNCRAILKRQEKRAGLRVTGWHTLRHTFCSHLAMRGAAPKAIQELAGHASIQVTERYMHLAPGSHRAAIALLEAFGQPVDNAQARDVQKRVKAA
jgi:integrase